jgi:putative hydrolase of the HAD superfamily
VFEDCRRKQQGSFTRRLIRSFLAEDQLEDVRRRATARWSYPPESVQADAHPALERLSGRYRLGVLANQEAWIRETLERDGLARFFELWAISAEVGIEKPDQRLFEHALREAEVPAERCVMIGDRLDNDIIPARRLGIRTIWLLRGEAPQDPSPEQRHVPDGCVKDLIEVPGRLELLGD